ncbi:hypothetical protein Tco_1088731 [Tanacetum coccineum]
MSTSKTYQQSLADAGSENRPPMLERGSYIPWESRFRRYLNQKRDNQKWLLKALDEGPYEFKNFVPKGSTIPRLQTTKDLEGDDLLLHDAEMEVMNMILLSILNEIYNSVDAYTSAKEKINRRAYGSKLDLLRRKNAPKMRLKCKGLLTLGKLRLQAILLQFNATTTVEKTLSRNVQSQGINDFSSLLKRSKEWRKNHLKNSLKHMLKCPKFKPSEHTSVIKDVLNVTVKGRTHKVSVVEEVRDISVRNFRIHVDYFFKDLSKGNKICQRRKQDQD